MEEIRHLLNSLKNQPVTQKSIGGDMLMLWLGVHPQDINALCLTFESPWNLKKAGKTIASGADIPSEPRKGESEAAFEKRMQQSWSLSDGLNNATICAITMDKTTRNLLVEFNNGLTVETTGTSEEDDLWHISRYETGRGYYVSRSGVSVEDL